MQNGNCVFLMNWEMCRNNKISLCCSDSQMTIIQQRSHFRQRTFSYIMHLNHCIFPPCWATMHISLSQWNIKHSYDLIFSSRGDFGLYSFSTSLESPRRPKLPGVTSFCCACLLERCLIGWRLDQSAVEAAKAQGPWTMSQTLNSRVGFLKSVSN